MNRYVYAFDLESDEDRYPVFWITPKEFWDEKGKCYDDCPELPDGFSNSQESAWEFNGTRKEAEAALAANPAFVLDPAFVEFIQG